MENDVKQLEATGAELGRLVQWFESAEDSSRDARITSEKCRDYYDGDQYTPEEIATLKKRKQPIIVVNRIKPKINTLKGMESKSRTNPKALPRNVGFDEEAAEACQDSIRYVLDENDSDTLFSACFDNLIIEGTEALEISVVPDQKAQDFRIELRQIHWDRQFSDPHGSEKSHSDDKYNGEVIWLDLEDALDRYPDAENVINATMEKFGRGDTYDDKPRYRWADGKRKRVCLISICYRKSGQWMHAVFVRGGFVQEPQPVPFVDEDGNSESMYLFQSAYVDRDGNRYGPVKDWLSQQDEINKRRSKALHLMSVRQVKTRKGAVDSIATLRNELAKPDGVVEENIENGVQILPTGDMAQAQFQLLAEAKAEIDAVGVNAAMSGTETRSMSGRALEARANAGSAEVQPILDAHAHFKNRVYRAIWNRIRQYWGAEKWVRVTDNEQNIKFVGLNQPVTMLDKVVENAKAKGRQFDPQTLDQLKQDPQMAQVVGQKNVPADMDVDIILDEVPDFAALQSEQFDTLAKIPGVPPQALIEASSLRNKDKILKIMRGETDEGPSPEVMQAQEQIKSMDEAIQGMSAEMQQKDDALRQSQIKAEQEKARSTKLEIDLYRTKAIEEIQSAQRELQAQMTPAAEPMQEGPSQEAMELEEVKSMVSQLEQVIGQAMQQQAQAQSETAAMLAGAIQDSAAQTQASIEAMAQAIIQDRNQPRKVKLSSGKVIEINPSEMLQ